MVEAVIFHFAYNERERLNTEYGVDAPPCLDTLRLEPGIYRRLSHLHNGIEALQDYQSELVKYYTEYYRYTKYAPCGGYCHFMFVDCAPSVFYGVLDYYRTKKKAYEALKNASSPILICFEYYKDQPKSIWVINDLPLQLKSCQAKWKVLDPEGKKLIEDQAFINLEADSALRITELSWKEKSTKCDVFLTLLDKNGKVVSKNHYHDPLHQTPRPEGYPEAFDAHYGMRIWAS